MGTVTLPERAPQNRHEAHHPSEWREILKVLAYNGLDAENIM